MDGALIMDKPAGITSHDVVQAVRRVLGVRRVGHLGTLDPFATGVLVLLIGKATRLARYYQHRPKTYRGVIRFGYSTDTMDATGRPSGEDLRPILSEQELRDAFAANIGPSMQRPPAFSAKKVDGVAAYRKARKGDMAELTPAPIEVYKMELLWTEGSRAGFIAQVSSGTYIRALAHDLGERLSCGAHLAELRRTAVGEFSERGALSIEDLQRHGVGARLVPLSDLLPELEPILLGETAAAEVTNGRNVELQTASERVRLLLPDGSLIAVADRTAEHYYHPVVVLAGNGGRSEAQTGGGSLPPPAAGAAGSR